MYCHLYCVPLHLILSWCNAIVKWYHGTKLRINIKMPKRRSDKELFQVALTNAQLQRLEQLAVEWGILWHGKPNKSGVISAIADGKVICQPREETYTLVEEQALDFIDRKQPFRIAYIDAQVRAWSFTVRYARRTHREKKYYLECWCEETQGNFDLSELQHNWSLRFDRISDAKLIPIEGEWRKNGLDTVEVEFTLLRGLAHAYEPRSNDIEDRIESSADMPTRIIKCNITNTFWFIREVLPYGKDCVIISPETVRDRIIQELKTALNNYS